MNCLTVNVCGFGEEVNRNVIRCLQSSLHLNFICIQETQLLDFTIINVKDCWNGSNFDSNGVNASDRSGWMISIWNREMFVKSEVLKNKHYLIVIGKWKGIDDNMIFVTYTVPILLPRRTLFGWN